jgi:hypothetical protein
VLISSVRAGSVEVGSGEAPTASAAFESEERSLPLHELLDVRLGDRSSAVRVRVAPPPRRSATVRAGQLAHLCRCIVQVFMHVGAGELDPATCGSHAFVPQTFFAHFRRCSCCRRDSPISNTLVAPARYISEGDDELAGRHHRAGDRFLI